MSSLKRTSMTVNVLLLSSFLVGGAFLLFVWLLAGGSTFGLLPEIAERGVTTDLGCFIAFMALVTLEGLLIRTQAEGRKLKYLLSYLAMAAILALSGFFEGFGTASDADKAARIVSWLFFIVAGAPGVKLVAWSIVQLFLQARFAFLAEQPT